MAARRLKVLHVLARMSPAGTEHQMASMLEAAHGHRWDGVLCLLHPVDNDLTRRVAATGVPLVHMRAGGSPAIKAGVLRKLMRRGGFDVIHSSLWGANAFTRLVALGRSRPAVAVSERRVEDYRSRRRRLLDHALRPVTDVYLANSEAVADFVCRAHGVSADRVRRVPNGIDRAIFRPRTTPVPRAGRAVRVGAVGRLVYQKGFDVLIASLPKVLAEYDIELEIAGQGELRGELEAQARGLPVRFVGLLEGPMSVASFLQGLDVFVMPSRYEGLPNAALEAAACGVAIVATDAPGMRAALGHRPLVPCEDPDALATTIIAAIQGGVDYPQVDVPDFTEVADAHLGAFQIALHRRRMS